jgi:hypothetical protein
MAVYVVTAGCYSDYRIEGIFSTSEKAERFKAELDNDANDVEEWELDELQEHAQRTVWTVDLDSDGNVVGEITNRKSLVAPRFSESYSRAVAAWNGVRYSGCSAVSEDHALKVAAEARQAHLRGVPATD